MWNFIPLQPESRKLSESWKASSVGADALPEGNNSVMVAIHVNNSPFSEHTSWSYHSNLNIHTTLMISTLAPTA